MDSEMAYIVGGRSSSEQALLTTFVRGSADYSERLVSIAAIFVIAATSLIVSTLISNNVIDPVLLLV